MLRVIEGDLLKSDCNVICHQANCQSTMGSGIAKQIKAMYPSVFRADRDFRIASPQERLGKCSYAVVKNNTVAVFNLYGQLRYGVDRQHTDYEALAAAMVCMSHELAELPFGTLKIGVPYGIGCGRGGGEWRVVSRMLEEFSKAIGLDIYAYQIRS